MYKFLKELQKHQSDTETVMRQLLLGQNVRKGKSRQKKGRRANLQYCIDGRRALRNNYVLTNLKNIGPNLKILAFQLYNAYNVYVYFIFGKNGLEAG